MAISPPSDLLLDVARAADPAKVREATARLARLAADPSAANEGFGKALSAAGQGGKQRVAALASPAPAAPLPVPTGGGSLHATAHAKGSVYKKFEAVLLQNFVESILPKDDESFGDAASAGIYRSMMAEQLANQLANAGGIGIAKAIEKAHPAGGATAANPLASS